MKLTLKKALTVATLSISAASFAPIAMAADITGAGATFPFPIYAKWAEAYKARTGNGMNYQSIGSSGGIKQIKAKTVDFGATDNPVKFEDLEKDGMVQFPAIIGGVVPIINVQGLKPNQLKLDGVVLADIFQGTITNWNDAANNGWKLNHAIFFEVFKLYWVIGCAKINGLGFNLLNTARRTD